MSFTRRYARRLLVFIRAFGVDPIERKSSSFDTWARRLDEQYCALRLQLGPDKAREARTNGRLAIRRLGLMTASVPYPVVQQPSKGKKAYKKSKEKLERYVSRNASEVRICEYCRMRCGLPKRGWFTKELAEKALKRAFQNDPALEVYLSPTTIRCGTYGTSVEAIPRRRSSRCSEPVC
jgi:hypothetical protein